MFLFDALVNATGRRRRPSLSLVGRTSKSSAPSPNASTLRRKNILAHGLLRMRYKQQASSNNAKVKTYDSEDDMVVVSFDDRHGHSSGPFSHAKSSPLRSSSASSSPARQPRSSISKENCSPCCSEYCRSRSPSTRSSFKHNLTKLLAPPAGIPLALLNGSAPYIRSIQPIPRPPKRRYEALFVEDETPFKTVDEEHPLTNRPPKRVKDGRLTPATEPGVVTRAAAARKMLETRRITRSMSSSRDLARLTASSSQRLTNASLRRRRAGSTSKTTHLPPSSPPSANQMPSLPTGWSIVDESEFRFKFSLSGDVRGSGSKASRLADWAVLQSSTSLYPGASTAMAAFATVANLRSIIENSEGVESQFVEKQRVKWDDMNYQQEYASDFIPPTPSNTMVPLFAPVPVPPVSSSMTVDGLPGSGTSTTSPPTCLAAPTQPGFFTSAIPIATSATAPAPMTEEEVDITEMLGHASSHSSSSFVKVSRSDAVLASPSPVTEAGGRNTSQTPITTTRAVTFDQPRKLSIRTRPLSLPPVPSPIKRRVSPTLVPQLKIKTQQQVPTSVMPTEHTGFGTVRASVFKNLRRDEEMKADDATTVFPPIRSECELSTVPPTAPNSPMSLDSASSGILSSFSSSIRLMGARSVSIPNRVGQPPPLPLPTQPHEWQLSRIDDVKTHRRAASSPALLSSSGIVLQGEPRGTQSALLTLLPAAVLRCEEVMVVQTMPVQPVKHVVGSSIVKPVPLMDVQGEGDSVPVKSPSRVFVVNDDDDGDLVSRAAYARPVRSRLRSRGLPPHIDTISQDRPPPRPRTPTPSSSAAPVQARGLAAGPTPLVIGTVALPVSGLPQLSPQSTTSRELQRPSSPNSGATRLRMATASPLARSAIVQRASKLSISSIPVLPSPELNV